MHFLGCGLEGCSTNPCFFLGVHQVWHIYIYISTGYIANPLLLGVQSQWRDMQLQSMFADFALLDA